MLCKLGSQSVQTFAAGNFHLHMYTCMYSLKLKKGLIGLFLKIQNSYIYIEVLVHFFPLAEILYLNNVQVMLCFSLPVHIFLSLAQSSIFIGPHYIDDPRWQCEKECISDMLVMPELNSGEMYRIWKQKEATGDPCGS